MSDPVDLVKLNNITTELNLLKEIFLKQDFLDSIKLELWGWVRELEKINKELWDIEDKLRVLEFEKKWEGEFVELARKDYFTNDTRFELKNEINKFTDSEIREVKEYVKYK
jgi:hypothetical protein